MTPGLKQAGKAAHNFSDEAGAAERSASKLSKAIEAIGAGAAAKSILDFGVSLSKAGAQAEQTFISFQTFLGGSEAAAKQLVGTMNEFANVTPFTNEQVYKAGRTLMAFGTAAGDVVPTLKLIGDVASGTGKDLGEMAVIFGQIKSTGKLMGQDLLQLINAGFNPLQEMARTSGKSVGQLKQEMEKGLVTFKMVEDAFKSATKEGGLFAGMMDKQSQTFAGLMSTLQGTLGTLAADFGQTLNSILKPALRGLVEFVGFLANGFKSLDESTRTAIVILTSGVALFVALGLAVMSAKAALVALGTSVGAVAGALAPFVAILAAIVAVAGLLIAAWSKLNSAQKSLVINSITAAFRSLWKAIKSVVDLLPSFDISGDFSSFLKKAGTGLGELVITWSFTIEKMGELLSIGLRNWANMFERWKSNTAIMLNDIASRLDVLVPERLRVAAGGRSNAQIIADAVGLGVARGQIEADAVAIQRTIENMNAELRRRIIAFRNAQGQGSDAPSVLPTGGVAPAPPPSDAIIKAWDKLGQSPDWRGVGERLGKVLAKSIGQGMSESGIAIAKLTGIMVEQAVETAQQTMMAGFQQAANNIQSTLNNATLLGDVFVRNWEAQKDRELEILEATEAAKLKAIRDTHFATMALLDEEFAAKKALLQQELEARLAFIEADRVARGLQAAEDAETQKQRVTDIAIVNEDARRNNELAQEEYEAKLQELAEQTSAKKESESKKSADAEAAAEADKAKKIEEFNAQKEAEQKDHGKRKAAIEYAFALAAYRVTQQQALAQAQFAYAASLVSAAQTVAAMSAATLGFGFPVALAIGATLVGMATVAYSAARSAIASTPPPMPSAELYAAEGGVLGGSSHQNGGTLVRAERGEAFLSRDLTSRLDAMTQNPMPSIIFAAGSIVVYGNLDQRMVDLLTTEFAKRIRQRGRV